MRSAAEIVADCNDLARQFYKALGYVVPEGYRFDEASHPQERSMWYMATLAYDHIEGTDVEEALAKMEGEAAEAKRLEEVMPKKAKPCSRKGA